MKNPSTTRWGRVRAEQRMQDIVRAAAEVFARKGYSAATVEEIANELQVTKASLYYYVSGKDEILYLVHKAAMDTVIDSLERILASDQPHHIKFENGIKNHIIVLEDEWSFVTMLLQQEHALSEEQMATIVGLRDYYDSLLFSELKSAILEGTLVAENPRLVLNAIFGAINWLPHWYRRTGSLPIEEVGNIICRYLMRGLRPGSGE